MIQKGLDLAFRRDRRIDCRRRRLHLHGKTAGNNLAVERALLKLRKKLGVANEDLRIGYEASRPVEQAITSIESAQIATKAALDGLQGLSLGRARHATHRDQPTSGRRKLDL